MSSRRLLTTLLALAAAPLLVPASATSASGCTITGTPGDDLLRGTNGDDVICGRGGNDDLRGRSGDDVLRGGTGDDSLYDTDRGDVLVGGPGQDWCNNTTRSSSCSVDTTPPSVGRIWAEVTSVDATDGPVDVVVRVAMSDETPLDASQTPTIYFFADGDSGHGGLDPETLRLESGSRTDGVWRATARVPRGMPPSEVEGLVYVRDTGLNLTQEWSDVLFEVMNAGPDLVAPRVHLRSPAANSQVGVRGAGLLRIRARIVDADTGLAGSVRLCFRALAGPTTFCEGSRLVSGDRHDGIWANTVDLERGLPTGRYCVEAYVSDHVRSVGVTCASALAEQPSMTAFARGESGGFRVVSR